MDVAAQSRFRGRARERARGLGWRWLADWRGGLALVALCLAAHWPGSFAIPPVDRDESRFAQASWQMLEAARAGDLEGLAVPRIQDRPRLNKPPLIYWLQATAAGAAGDDGSFGTATGGIGWYRIPSLISAMVAVLLTWRIGLTLRLGAPAAWLGGAILATCVMVLWDARQARADQLLLATTTAAMLMLAHLWRRRHSPKAQTRWWALGFHACIALGILAKGPITLMVVTLTVLAVSAHRRELSLLRHARPLAGVVVISLVVAPWVIAVGQSVGWGAYWSIVLDETIGRAGSAKESHWGPPGYHLVLLAVLLFPGSLVTARAVMMAFRRRGRSAELFLLAWVVPSWIVFELIATKLPHYTLPLYPALALLTARELVRLSAPGAWRDPVGRAIYLVIAAAIVVALPVGLLCSGVGDWPVALPAVLPGIALLGVAAWSLVRGNLLLGQLNAIFATVFQMMAIAMILLPHHDQLWVSSRLAAVVAESDPAGERPIAAVGYHEDSLIFLTRGRAERFGANDAAAWMVDHPSGILIRPDGASPVENPPMRPLGAVEGVNYSTGDRVSLVVEERDAGRGSK